MAAKYYVVWKGQQPGIYLTWEECQKQIMGFPNAQYKSFKTLEEARYAFEHPEKVSVLAFELNTDYPELGLCVDAAYSSDNKNMEYRGVVLPDKKELFHVGPIAGATNNIGEFLAIVHALALCTKHHWDYTIYSDSQTAIVWVLRKKANTQLEPTEANKTVFDLIQRAEKWLLENTFTNQIKKWNTQKWGEIPADFGRK